jgi:hypothetical protein
MKHKQNVVVAIALSVAAGFLALQNVSAPTPDEAVQTAEVETIVTEPPTVDASIPQQCAYTWAYRDAPELTQKLDAAVKALNPEASARAQFFGEDCVYADGQSTFGAMETDFYINLPIDDLTNQDAFGNWMVEVMPIVAQIPREKIQGNYGFVEFLFGKFDAEHVIIRVPVQKYMDEGKDKTGSDLFRLFSATPSP